MRILASVLTHNRVVELYNCLNNIINQTRTPDQIIVINNESTDNTTEILKDLNLEVITQKNTGSAQGWHKAIEYALDNNFDLIWLMDDDGLPDLKSLEFLENNFEENMSCISSTVVHNNNPDLFVFPMPRLDTNNRPILFSLIRKYKNVSELKKLNIFYEYVHLFNGVLINLRAVKIIGNVNKNLVHHGVEVDFFYRLLKYGPCRTLLTSIHYHPNVEERKINNFWIYYTIRNQMIVNYEHLNNHLFRNILIILITVLRIYKRNGILSLVSYIIGFNSKIFYSAIVDGFKRKKGQKNFKKF